MSAPGPRFGPERLDDPLPHVQVLAGGEQRCVLTAAGSGGSFWNEVALTRWIPDPVEDAQGWYVYLRDLDSGALWSAGLQPTAAPIEDYEVAFSPGAACIQRRDHAIACRVDVGLCPHSGVELRRCELVNHDRRSRRIELTSYLEVVLQEPAADAAHPAFSKLFVQTRRLSQHALAAWRRRRAPEEPTRHMAHWVVGAPAEHADSTSFETDRMCFIGRGRSLRAPAALVTRDPLSGTLGPVLDPALVWRCVLDLEPGGSGVVTFALAAARSEEGLGERIASFDNAVQVRDALEAARRAAAAELRNIGLDPAGYAEVQALLGPLLYGGMREVPPELAESGLQAHIRSRFGLRPGRPTLVLEADPAAPQSTVRTALRASAWLRRLGIEHQALLLCAGQEAVRPLQTMAQALDVPIHDSTRLVPREQACLRALADAYVGTAPFPAPRSNPANTVDALSAPAVSQPRTPGAGRAAGAEERPGELRFDNGIGGFTPDGRRYCLRVDGARDRLPPQPWCNVVANPRAGFIATERGAGNTWALNSRQYRITPWSNDPVCDPHGEAFYLRDEDTGEVWSPMPGPIPPDCSTRVIHGFGFTRYVQHCRGLAQETLQFMAREAALKCTHIRLRNDSSRPRHIRLLGYAQLVLGVLPAETRRSIHTAWDVASGSLLARNPESDGFGDQVVGCRWLATRPAMEDSFTTSRLGFIGRHRDSRMPLAVESGRPLDGWTGTGLDPCFAVSACFSLEPGAALDWVLMLGAAPGREPLLAMLDAYADPTDPVGGVSRELAAVRQHWELHTRALQIQTPSPALDTLFNGWALYQNLSCRMFGRSAFYQSGGAYGFRDQLQDAGALVYVRPDLTRRQILLHAAHQFAEGDVLHWWHPPTDRGIRTRFSDDLLWLPYATADYVAHTGDRAVLDEPVPFLRARALRPDEDEAYLAPEDSGELASLYEHCCRALDRSLTHGPHGLPLMGTGDWNDGMNRVGRGGRGESVWLGFFLFYILGRFLPLCEARGDTARSRRYRRYRAELERALNEAGWDGRWYRRAFYDDGTPLGSAHSDECRIDAIAQAWAVISGAAPPQRAARALDALETHLVDERAGLIRLLTPAFDRTPKDPGYIKGYVPGVRENGGQYTHGALWAVKALLEAGRHERGARLLERLTPIAHTLSPADVARYRVEPYVIAADVYGEPPHTGRGGWTWYTGSAGWLYRVILESLLGFTLRDGSRLRLAPRIPKTWPGFRIHYRLPDGRTEYDIQVHNPQAPQRPETPLLTVDDEVIPAPKAGPVEVDLVRDGKAHRVRLVLGGDHGKV